MKILILLSFLFTSPLIAQNEVLNDMMKGKSFIFGSYGTLDDIKSENKDKPTKIEPEFTEVTPAAKQKINQMESLICEVKETKKTLEDASRAARINALLCAVDRCQKSDGVGITARYETIKEECVEKNKKTECTIKISLPCKITEKTSQ